GRGGRPGKNKFWSFLPASNETNYSSGKSNSSLGSPPAAGCVFNDVTKGNIGVACLQGSTSLVDGKTTWCSGSNPTNGVTVFNGSVAFGAGPEYDAATGLGSINVTNLLTKWSTFLRAGTTTAISGATGGATSGSNFSATVSVTPAGATGDVSLTAPASGGATIL